MHSLCLGWKHAQGMLKKEKENNTKKKKKASEAP